MELKDFESHRCNLSLKECKTIEVVYFQDGSCNDRKLITGWGIDGTLYTFEVVPRQPIPFIQKLTDEKKQSFRTDDKETEPPNNVQI
jgi:hypothetical protein